MKKEIIIKHRNSKIEDGKQINHYNDNSKFEYIIEETTRDIIITAAIKYPIDQKEKVYDKIDKTGQLPLLKELKNLNIKSDK